MNKVDFNLIQFCQDKRLTNKELAAITNTTPVGVYYMAQRGTIKLSYLRRLEALFGNIDQYIIREKETERKAAV